MTSPLRLPNQSAPLIMTPSRPYFFTAAPGLAALGVIALAGCATVADTDPASADALRRMSDKLASADQFALTATRRLDRQLIDNPNSIGTATISAALIRPGLARATTTGGNGNVRSLYITPEGSTIYSQSHNFYATFPGHPTVEEAFDAASANLGVHFPAQDFLAANPYRSFSAGSDSIRHAGVEPVAGQSCDHLRGTREDLHWDLWIDQATSLPVRYTITVAGLEGSDHLQLDFQEWNLTPSLDAGSFRFSPPAGAEEIEFLAEVEIEGEAAE